MLNKMVKNKKRIIIAAFITIGLGVGLSFYATWANAQKEVKNITTTHQNVGQVVKVLDGKWVDKSSCYITNAHRFDSTDNYFCNAKYTAEYSPRDTNGAIELFVKNQKALSSSGLVTAITESGSDLSGAADMYVYTLGIRGVIVDGAACALTYWHDKQGLNIKGELECHKQVSHEAYDVLAKSGYPITIEQ